MHPRIISLAIFFLLACQTTGPKSREVHPDPKLANKIEELIQQTDHQASVGIQIVSLKSSRVIFERQAKKLFTPASTLKLLTGAAALHYLGSHHRFKTEILADFPSKGWVKHIYLRGSGDPSFNDGNLYRLANQLSQTGVRAISGDIFVDDTAFDDKRWPAGWMWDDLEEGYSAPIGALSLNWNQILVSAKPGSEGKPVRVYLDPFTELVPVKSQAKTVSHRSQKTFIIESVSNRGIRPKDAIRAHGTLPRRSRTVYQKFAVADPALFAGLLLGEQLKRLGIQFSGKVLRHKAPVNLPALAEHESQSVGEILIDLMKLSSNHGFESLTKILGVTQDPSKAGNWDDGIDAIYAYLKKELGIQKNDLKIADGSGGSRYSLVSPAQLVKLLRHAWTDFHIGPEFVASLPVSGRDGSLMYRMGDNAHIGNIRAKTGGMSGVNNLAGYVETKDGDVLVFAIMINGYVSKSPKPYYKLQEDILGLFLK